MESSEEEDTHKQIFDIFIFDLMFTHSFIHSQLLHSCSSALYTPNSNARFEFISAFSVTRYVVISVNNDKMLAAISNLQPTRASLLCLVIPYIWPEQHAREHKRSSSNMTFKLSSIQISWFYHVYEFFRFTQFLQKMRNRSAKNILFKLMNSLSLGVVFFSLKCV